MAGGSVRAPFPSIVSVRSGSYPGRAAHRSWSWTACAAYSRQTGQLRGFRRATERARRSGQGLTTAVMFLLVPQVKLRKRLDVARAAERWSGRLPSLVERSLRPD